MNSKEALERLNKHFNLDCYSFDNDENSKVTEYSIIKQSLDRLEQLEKQIKRWAEKYAFVEKELVQTKKNFKNSQTHSKNCYKKLKGKYEKLEKEKVFRHLQSVQEFEKEIQGLKEEKDFAWEKSRENWAKYQKECDDVTEYLLVIEKKNEELIRYEKALDILKKNIVSKKRIQSLRETANPKYEVVLHIPQNVLKEVLESDSN